MKKVILSATLFFLFFTRTQACSWYDPDYEYFNLFTQSIIKDKTYLPFLHTFSNRFYGHEHFEIPDENIENWQKYFGNALSYSETKMLVELLPMNDLNDFKRGNTSNIILKKLGSYQKFSEGIDYLIEAKYLEPYMRIKYVESPDSFYYSEDKTQKNATELDYYKTINALTSLYKSARNKDIKLRYGYQLVRFYHYTRNYEESYDAFTEFVKPLKSNSAPYFLALDQLAGVQRGLQDNADANWNFFQVFMNSKSRKESAFISMKLSDSASFNDILKRAQTPQEKNMAYFLLAYEDFTNPIPTMEKMYDIDPNSEILKVLAARSINELERYYLPISIPTDDQSDLKKSSDKISDPKVEKTTEVESVSFWQKIKNFFSNLFSSGDEKSTEESNGKSDSDLLNDPNRIPLYNKDNNRWSDSDSPDFLNDFEKFTKKTKEKSTDEFWKIADAYLSFLKKDYEESSETLDKIETKNPEYLTQINRLKMLNYITSRPKIDAEFEDELYKNYKEFFVQKPPSIETDSLSDNFGNEAYDQPSTNAFLEDLLANRYFIQGEDAKSFLMNNKLSDLRYNPNLALAQKLQEFIKKPNKTNFEKDIIAKNIDKVGNPDAFFNVIYGDFAMRDADFEKAKKYYEKANGFSGIPLPEGYYDYNTGEYVKYTDTGGMYDGFKNINPLIFGHNVWESYQSADETTMKAENFVNEFPFIKDKMTKLDLATAAAEFKKAGNKKDEMGAKANQLIGNLLYNTSVLGYYRELFVMDIDNSNGGKYYFGAMERPFQYYYKDYSWTTYSRADNFDLAIQYYQKALATSNDKEQKARLLFQMGSAEQGKYYQYEAKNQSDTDYNDPNWSQKEDAFAAKLAQTKNQKYRTYFAALQKNYADTETAKSLQGSCSYFEYFLRTH